jgi:predicted NAD/FAD-binding protein
MTSTPNGRRSIAVVGAGVSGLTAAWILQRAADITLYEALPRLGGHAHTHDVEAGSHTVAVDSGFIVHNTRTYPQLLRLFSELGVATRETEMSMSVRCDGCGLEYAGAKGIGGVFASARTARKPAYLRMLVEVKRFHRAARRLLEQTEDTPRTLDTFLRDGRYSTYFIQHFMVPVVSCVWSCAPADALQYPARYLFQFLDHHGMLAVSGSPTWRTVVGGSRSYVERAAKELTAVRANTPVTGVAREAGSVLIRTADSDTTRHDAVVIATHADEALTLLDDPTPDQRRVLGAFGYSLNHTVLHTDDSVLPTNRQVRASWNYRLDACQTTAANVQVSYDMNRLQGLTEPDQYVVTLNADDRIRADQVIASMDYTHPIYTTDSLAAQAELAAISDGTLAFAGAYHGWGFHEDGCASGVRAAARLGVAW